MGSSVSNCCSDSATSSDPNTETKESISGDKIPIIHMKDIEVGESISSIALLSTHRLLVADSLNNTVRLVTAGALGGGAVVSELELPSRPHQIARISDKVAAVTLPGDNKIVLLSAYPQLLVVRDIEAGGECLGIAYMDGTLIVGFKDGGLDKLDMAGKVLRTIRAKQTGEEFFDIEQQSYVTASPATGSLYVSNWAYSSRLVKWSADGSEQSVYFPSRQGMIGETVVDSQGMVYVTWDGDTYGVEQLDANCRQVQRTIVGDLLSPPKALSYDEYTKLLYVGQVDGVVKLYMLAYNKHYSAKR